MAISLLHGQTIATGWAERLVRDVQASSFPEMARKGIRVQQFARESDFFQARFSIWRFLTGRKMQCVIRVNSAAELLTASEEGRRAIVAHELAHVTCYAKGNRHRLFLLIRFPSKDFRERFEKRACRYAGGHFPSRELAITADFTTLVTSSRSNGCARTS